MGQTDLPKIIRRSTDYLYKHYKRIKPMENFNNLEVSAYQEWATNQFIQQFPTLMSYYLFEALRTTDRVFTQSSELLEGR